MDESIIFTIYMIIQGFMLFYIIVNGIFFFCKRKESRTVRAFSYVCAGICVWGTGEFTEAVILEWFPSEMAFFWANKFTYVGMCVLGPATLLLAWVYCGKYKLYTNWRIIRGLMMLAVVFWFIILTDPLHHLYYRFFSIDTQTYAPLMVVFTIWSYACFLYSGVSVVIWYGRRKPEYIKYFLLCYSLPLLSNALNMVQQSRLYDMTVPSLFSVMIGVYILVYRHRVVNLLPMASHKILSELREPVYIFSPVGEVLFENHVAIQNPELVLYERKRGCVIMKNGQVYKAKYISLADGNNMLTFVDITECSEMLGELKKYNSELRDLQTELQRQMKDAEEYASIAEIYAAQRSRWKITNKMNSEIYVVIHQILENTTEALEEETLELDAIKRNIALTMEGARMVRLIINEFKGAKRYGF